MSWTYHLEKLRKAGDPELQWHIVPEGYWDLDFESRLTLDLKVHCNQLIQWVSGWHELRSSLSNKLEISFVHFEDMRANPRGFIENILQSYGIDTASMEVDLPEATEKIHFRSGLIDEWKSKVDRQVRQEIWDIIPVEISREFGWQK